MLLFVLLLPGENGLVITVLKAIRNLSNDMKNRLQIIVAIAPSETQALRSI